MKWIATSNWLVIDKLFMTQSSSYNLRQPKRPFDVRNRLAAELSIESTEGTFTILEAQSGKINSH